MLSLEVIDYFYKNDLYDVYNIIKNYKELFEVMDNDIETYNICDFKVNFTINNYNYDNDDKLVLEPTKIKLILKIYENFYDKLLYNLSLKKNETINSFKKYLEDEIMRCICNSHELTTNKESLLILFEISLNSLYNKNGLCYIQIEEMSIENKKNDRIYIFDTTEILNLFNKEIIKEIIKTKNIYDKNNCLSIETFNTCMNTKNKQLCIAIDQISYELLYDLLFL